MKIAILGPYPKPYGGVSIHIKRLKEVLEKNNISCIVYDVSKVPKVEKKVIAIRSGKILFLKRFLQCKEDIIHYHTGSLKWVWTLCLFAFAKNKKLMITLHSFRQTIKKMNCWIPFQLATKGKLFFIAVGPEIKDKLVSLGINKEYVKIIPSFISPVIRENEIAEIPQNVWDFIDRHNPIISANAFKIVLYNGVDLYGIDMCIDLCANLKHDFPQIGFVFSLPDIGVYDYFNKMKQRITEKGVEDNFIFQTKPCQFYPILMKSDLFVRPTNMDGYGISIVEAIFLGVPAVASDVCKRVDCTILFKNRDINDFSSKVRNVLFNYPQYKEKIQKIELRDDMSEIIKLYKEFNKGNER